MPDPIVLSDFGAARFVADPDLLAALAGGARRGFPPAVDRTPTPVRPAPSRHPEQAGSVCQCVAPEFCTRHPDTAPLVAAEPDWNTAAPGSPVARTGTRLTTRPAGALPYRDDPGQVRYDVPPLANLTDAELAQWTHAVLAEHQRRLTAWGGIG